MMRGSIVSKLLESSGYLRSTLSSMKDAMTMERVGLKFVGACYNGMIVYAAYMCGTLSGDHIVFPPNTKRKLEILLEKARERNKRVEELVRQWDGDLLRLEEAKKKISRA